MTQDGGQKSVLGGAGQNILMSESGYGDAGLNQAHKTIGSIKNRQINNSPEHTFFNPNAHTYDLAKQVVPVVKDEIDRDYLGKKPAKWSSSVALPKYMGDPADMTEKNKRFLISKGFYDENITRSDPQTTYAGCDTRDVYYHGWDISHETTPPRDKERQYQMERAFLMDKTARIADKVTQHQNGDKTKYGITTAAYITPEEISRRMNEKIRVEKDQETELWKDLLAKARYEMPAASQEKLSAIVHR